MKLSIIIPTLQEEAAIGRLLPYLFQHLDAEAEVIVADGGSQDATCLVALQTGARVVQCQKRGRAAQMNAGARQAKGSILYFLHADTFPPKNFQAQIQQALKAGCKSGCFRLAFDEAHWFLRFNAWFTRFDVDAVRFGDQSLFVQRENFFGIGGFDEDHILLEDQEIIGRLKKTGPFQVLPAAVVTSARRYRQIGIIRLQACYYLIYALYRLGWPQPRLLRLYKQLLG